MLQRDLVDPELRRPAIEHSRSIRAELTALIAEVGERFRERPEVVADDLYTVWNGAMMTWAIDGEGGLSDWLDQRLRRLLDLHSSSAGRSVDPSR